MLKRNGARTAVALAFLFLIFSGASSWAAKQPKQPKITDAECIACHADAGLTKEVNGKPVSLAVDQEKFKGSVHGMFGCTDCHTDIKSAPHETPPATPKCATCHAEENAAYNRGFHAQAVKHGDKLAATCQDCHGRVHEILPITDPKSKVHRSNIPATCGTCHGQKFVMEASGHSAQPFINYEESVHGKSVAKEGDKSKAAVCTDCHGAHDILNGADPKSSIAKANVPFTCGKCHTEVEQKYIASIHGQAVTKGNWQAPVCTDCHGIHTIKAPSNPSSSVSALNISRYTCGRCHENVRLASEFGMPAGRESTYLASYHGLASESGSTVVANCASCHGAHDILPSSDPRSKVNHANLKATCGQCHRGISDKFLQGKVHVNAPLSADIGSVVVRWIRRMYLTLILVTIGAMLLHNLIIWRRKALLRRDAHRRIVRRMDTNQRIQHLTLLISFFVLVITGFALKFPDSWFAELLNLNETLRSILHRTAGGVLIAAGLYHVGYLLISAEGRRLMLAMLPEPKDVVDALDNMRHYLGLNVSKPQFKRFNYAEKAEYWALVWGTIVMAGTGLALWFKVQVGHTLPRWWLDVATAIHFYEAVLATLAIIVWHFYQVFFDPDVYPMNWAWYDGKVSVEHYQDEHGLDIETVRRAVDVAAAESGEPEPVPPASEEEKQPVGPRH
ncbi:MAG: cytochrome b/b6 domain-containing protein [Acidobacteriia bacterium]|nr:cytochrome b/b6 domain-containing protein [Terriglobia bacterium]